VRDERLEVEATFTALWRTPKEPAQSFSLPLKRMVNYSINKAPKAASMENEIYAG
jgi:hypothetical protein